MKLKSLLTTLLISSTGLMLVACDSGSGGDTNNRRRDAERYCESRYSRSSVAYDDCVDEYLRDDRYGRNYNDYKFSWEAYQLNVSGDRDSLERLYMNNGACSTSNLNTFKCGRMNSEVSIRIETDSLKIGTEALITITPISEDWLGQVTKVIQKKAKVKERAGDTLAIDKDGISIIIDNNELIENRMQIELRYNSESIASGYADFDENDDDWRYDDFYRDDFYYNDRYCDPYYDRYCY